MNDGSQTHVFVYLKTVYFPQIQRLRLSCRYMNSQETQNAHAATYTATHTVTYVLSAATLQMHEHQ